MNEYLEKDMVTPEGARKLADAFDEACKYGPANVLRDLSDQVEALQADAERYRWLKSRPLDWAVEHQRNGWSTCYGFNELDAAIDAARKDQP